VLRYGIVFNQIQSKNKQKKFVIFGLLRKIKKKTKILTVFIIVRPIPYKRIFSQVARKKEGLEKEKHHNILTQKI
jgi:hypothetical protein